MDRELRAIADAKTLGEAEIDSLYCSSTMCKIALKAGEDASVNRASLALNERLPRMFAAVFVYPNGTGHGSLYLAKSNELLAIRAESTHSATSVDETPGAEMAQEP